MGHSTEKQILDYIIDYDIDVDDRDDLNVLCADCEPEIEEYENA